MRIGRAIIGCLILAVCGLARADLIYFVRGGEVQLPSKTEGRSVRIETAEGPRIFPMDEILAIVPEPIGENASKAGSPEDRFASAWSALENGETERAIEVLKDPLPDGSNHGPTRRTLEALDRLALPCPEPDRESVRRRLRPDRFEEASSAHVVLFHQSGASEARDRLDLLERVISTFYLSLAAQGIELNPLRERLVSVWFADRQDYAAFLRRVEAEPFADTQGYYHPTLRVVFAFDPRSLDAQLAGRRAIANRRKEGAPDFDLDRQALLLDLNGRAIDQGIAAHETIHQLTAASGLAPRLDDFPTWLHEGFAAQFEVVRGGRWAGVGRVHDLRLPDWRTIRPSPRLAPLLRDVGLGQGYRRDLYAESWALVYFLRKTRPDDFRTYLDLLRAPSPEASVRPDRAVDAFRAAFGGDLNRIETEWHQYLAGLRTPLEAHRPSRVLKESHLVRPGADH